MEATKFTEVGYVGRDVESMVRDLMEIGITLVREEENTRVRAAAEAAAESRLLDLLLPNSFGGDRNDTRENCASSSGWVSWMTAKWKSK